jgi:hypothetical protein
LIGPVRSQIARGGFPAVRVIDEDPDLLGGLDGTLADAVRHQLVARTLSLELRAWEPLGNDIPPNFDGWLGMLVLEGLLVRQVDSCGSPSVSG